jgi:hypothetical protein
MLLGLFTSGIQRGFATLAELTLVNHLKITNILNFSPFCYWQSGKFFAKLAEN